MNENKNLAPPIMSYASLRNALISFLKYKLGKVRSEHRLHYNYVTIYMLSSNNPHI